jgi:hypothetical protein
MPTENNNYNTPARGVADWDTLLNENFRLLDTDVEYRDTDANKSNYTPKLGAKYFTTDSPHRIYLGDGSNWVEVTDLAAGQNINHLGTNRADYDSGLSQYLIRRHPGEPGVQYEVTLLNLDVIGPTSVNTDIELGVQNPGGANPSVNSEETLTTSDAALPLTLADGADLDVYLTTDAAFEDVSWTVKFKEV